MHREIEETVSFFGSFLYGKIPRCRIDAFCEQLANALVEQLCQRAIVLLSTTTDDGLLEISAKKSHLDWEEALVLLPKDLLVEVSSRRVIADFGGCTRIIYSDGGRMLLRTGVRPCFVVSFDPRFPPSTKPVFKLVRSLPTWTARDFCATRFGSAKLKTFPNAITGKEEARLLHPYTAPSVYSYLKYLVYLNLIVLSKLLNDENSEKESNVV